MTATWGSYVAVLRDGRHRTLTGQFRGLDEFRHMTADMLKLVADEVGRFWYFWGTEHREYTGTEFKDVFLSR